MKTGQEFCQKAYMDDGEGVGGRMSGSVYMADEKHWELVSGVMKMYQVVNPLHID
jgi:hypothetical protein